MDSQKINDNFLKFHELVQISEVPVELKPYCLTTAIEEVVVDATQGNWLIKLHYLDPPPANLQSALFNHLSSYIWQKLQVKATFTFDPEQTKFWWQALWQMLIARVKTSLGDQATESLFASTNQFKDQRLFIELKKPTDSLASIETILSQELRKLTGVTFSLQVTAPPLPKLPKTTSAHVFTSSTPLNKPLTERPTSITELTAATPYVVISGNVFKADVRTLKNNLVLFLFFIYDGTSSIVCKYFTRKESDIDYLNQIKNNTRLKVAGALQPDARTNELGLMIKHLQALPPTKEEPASSEKRVELHAHTTMSALDGMSSASDLIAQAAAWGHPAIAITDHGVAQAYPEAYAASKKYPIKVIYGIEANIFNDQTQIVLDEQAYPLDSSNYIVYDIETTGFSVKHDQIIEIAAVKLVQGSITERYQSLIKIQRSLSQKTTELTGITDEMLTDAQELPTVLEQFLAFIGEKAVLVAHNHRFDLGFLNENLKRCNLATLDHPKADTLELARTLYPTLKNHRLNTLAQKLGVSLARHHRALDDAEATAHIFWSMQNELAEKHGLTTLEELNQCPKEPGPIKQSVYHATLLAKNKIGLKNLYQLITASHLDYFYRVPRIPLSMLKDKRKGLLIGSGCERGEVFEAALFKTKETAKKLARFYDYLEIQPQEVNKHLKTTGAIENLTQLDEANQLITELGQELQLPVVATANVHYLTKNQTLFRTIVHAGPPSSSPNNSCASVRHFRSTAEMLADFEYLGKEKAREVVIDNPLKIADQIDEQLAPFPEGTFTPKLAGAAEELRTVCYDKAHELYGDPLPDIVEARLEKELTPIIKYEFSDLYIISRRIVQQSLKEGYLVGSRGSVGSSLVATLSGITEVNPLAPHWRCPKCKTCSFITDGSYESGFDLPDKNCVTCQTKMVKDGQSIPFETFLGLEANKTPDIDLNFSSEYQPYAHEYVEEMLGKKSIFRAGTISTIQNKTAYGYVRKYLDETGEQKNAAEIERLVQGCTGIKRTTGQHPGGLIVIPSDMDVHDFTPVQYPADATKTKVTTTHFDYHSLSGRLLKLDLLGHQDPTSIRMLQQLTGVDPLSIPFDDPKTLSLFSSPDALGPNVGKITGQVVGTLGVPEFGTHFVRQMLEQTQPAHFSELIRISGLSHGTDVWLGNTQDLIKEKTCKLSDAICTRDDIMQYLILQGMDSCNAFYIMEKVRKGKGLAKEEEELMREHNVPAWYIASCQKISYMFPRAHAVAYVMMAVRIAWFKVHHPIAYYATYFYRLLQDFNAELIVQGLSAIQKTMQKIKKSGNAATQKEKNLLTLLESVQEYYARGFDFKPIDLYKSHAKHFVIDGKSLILPFFSINGVGETAAINIMTARNEHKKFISIKDFQKKTKTNTTHLEALEKMGCFEGMPKENQLVLF
ncbi:MAG: PolC-type polymerase [Bacillota bacterium]